jgi:DnaK suppressor protein
MTRALLRKLLEVRRDDLRQRLGLVEVVAAPSTPSGPGHGHDAADAGAERAAAVEAHASREHLERQLREVLAALERFAARTYGACTDCGEPIAPIRLRAVPWVATCISCQEARERTALPAYVRIVGEPWSDEGEESAPEPAPRGVAPIEEED